MYSFRALSNPGSSATAPSSVFARRRSSRSPGRSSSPSQPSQRRPRQQATHPAVRPEPIWIARPCPKSKGCAENQRCRSQQETVHFISISFFHLIPWDCLILLVAGRFARRAPPPFGARLPPERDRTVQNRPEGSTDKHRCPAVAGTCWCARTSIGNSACPRACPAICMVGSGLVMPKCTAEATMGR